MAKMVLIEAHPLLRLGLWQILSKLDDVWEIEGMGLADVSKADGVHAGADLSFMACRWIPTKRGARCMKSSACRRPSGSCS